MGEAVEQIANQHDADPYDAEKQRQRSGAWCAWDSSLDLLAMRLALSGGK
jgi:hypothetical protein